MSTLTGVVAWTLMAGWGALLAIYAVRLGRIQPVLAMGLDAVYQEVKAQKPCGGPGIREPVPCIYRFALVDVRLCVLELGLSESSILLWDGRRVAAPGIASDRWEATMPLLAMPVVVHIVLDEPIRWRRRRARFEVSAQRAHLLPSNWSE